MTTGPSRNAALSCLSSRLIRKPAKSYPAPGGIRKVRWGKAGRGKRGGVRVIYFNRLSAGEVWLLVLYTKSEAENITAHVLRRIKEEIENG